MVSLAVFGHQSRGSIGVGFVADDGLGVFTGHGAAHHSLIGAFRECLAAATSPALNALAERGGPCWALTSRILEGIPVVSRFDAATLCSSVLLESCRCSWFRWIFEATCGVVEAVSYGLVHVGVGLRAGKGLLRNILLLLLWVHRVVALAIWELDKSLDIALVVDVDVRVVIVDHDDSTAGFIGLNDLLFWWVVIGWHDTGSSGSSCVSGSLVRIWSHFLELSVVIKLLLIRHVSSVSSLDGIYYSWSSLTHPHLLLGVLNQVGILLSGCVQTFDCLKIDAILPFVCWDCCALSNLLRWLDEWGNAAKWVFLTFGRRLNGRMNHVRILIEHKAHLIRGCT